LLPAKCLDWSRCSMSFSSPIPESYFLRLVLPAGDPLQAKTIARLSMLSEWAILQKQSLCFRGTFED
jgi:hypothetical protein